MFFFLLLKFHVVHATFRLSELIDHYMVCGKAINLGFIKSCSLVQENNVNQVSESEFELLCFVL